MNRFAVFKSRCVAVSRLALGTILLLPLLNWTGSPAAATTYRFPAPPTSATAPATGRSRGGASRGACPEARPPLTALVPTAGDTVWGLTTQAQPSFWFYLPYALTADRPGEFVLLDDQGNYIYQTPVLSAAPSGIIRVAIPETVSLELDRAYQWTFLVSCGTNDPLYLQGGIQRVSPIDLPAGEPLAVAQRSAAQGIWFDALSQVAELHAAQPADPAITTTWRSLLEAASLADLVEQPIVDCCTTD